MLLKRFVISSTLFRFSKVLEYFGIIIPATQRTITCSKLTIETLEQGVKHVQS